MSGRSLRDEIRARLLAGQRKIPTSSLLRLGKLATTAIRSGRYILGHDAAADEDVDVDALARIVATAGELKGIAMKAGQLMSYTDVALPEAMRQALSTLQTHAQPMTFDQVSEIVRQELGDRAGALLEAMDREVAAAASIGQVHRARLPDGTPVAVKVQYPGIERAIEADFGPSAVPSTITAVFYPGARIKDFIDEARRRFLEECDYLHEARIQARFAELYAGDPTVVIPAVHPPYCSRRVFVSSWVDGAGFEEFLARDPDQATRDRVGEALFEFYVGSLFRRGLYNCDPHPGNYLFVDDGRIAMLDYGCTRVFEPEFVAKLAALTRAVHADDPARLRGALVDLGIVREGKQYDFATARDLIRAFYGPMLQDRVQRIDLGSGMGFRHMAERKREMLKLRLPGEFLFLFRIRFGLMSVLARLGACQNWHRLEQSYLEGLPA